MSHLTLIGLSPVSASIGLALKRAGLKTEIVGTDRDRAATHAAEKMGAIDRATRNLRSAVEEADMVVLDLPMSEIEEILEAIGPILENGCVVTDTGTTKAQIIEWGTIHLRPDASFVGGHPLIKRQVTTMAEANASLFDKTEYCVIPSEKAGSQAVKTVVGMVEALGARPLFLDADEHDSYSAAMAQLPKLLSTVLINMLSSSPSWREVSRLAGPEFHQLSQLSALDPTVDASYCTQNAEPLKHWLDQMIAELSSCKEKVSASGDDLLESFINAWEQREKLELGELQIESTGPEIPSAGQHMAGLIVGPKWAERSNKMAKSDDQPAWKFRGRR